MDGRYGVFTETNDAVMASKGAYERFSTFSLNERGELIKELRLELCRHAQELAAMEKEETGMGVYEDKLCQILKAVGNTPGASYVTQEASTDEEGLLLQESFPFGVSCVIHPANHPVASIINHTIMLLAAGNSVIHLIPKRAEKVCQCVIEKMNETVAELCGIDHLIICMANNRYEYNLQVMEHPDVSLVVVTGGNDVVNKALCVKKRVIASGCANPVVIIDSSADIRNAAKDVAEAVAFDNNLLCTSEKCAVVLADVSEEWKQRLKEQKAYFLTEEEAEKLEKTVFGIDMQVCRGIIGQSAAAILVKAGILPSYDESIRLIAFEAEATSPFVMNEVAAPILPIVEACNFKEAMILAKFIEQGYGHTAGIFSKNIDHLSEASRELQTAVFVKNGSTLYGAGIKGNAPVTFTIANITGEGAVSPKHFVRNRKCILKGSFERR